MGSLACTAPLFTAHFHKRLSLAATSFGTGKTQRTWAVVATVATISSLKLVRHTRGRWHSLVPLWLCTCAGCWAKKTYFAESAQRTWNPCFKKAMSLSWKWQINESLANKSIKIECNLCTYPKSNYIFWARGSFYLLTHVNVSRYRTSMINSMIFVRIRAILPFH